MKKIIFALLFITMAFSQFDNSINGWYNGAFYVSSGDVYSEGLIIADESTLAAETLDEVDFATNVNWTDGGDWAYVAGVNFEYVWVTTRTSEIEQFDVDFITAAVGSRWYVFTYTIALTTAFDGDGAVTITNSFALTAVSLDITTGTHTIYFKSAVTPTDFVISVVSGTDTEGTFTIDDVTLKEITGGDIYASGTVNTKSIFATGSFTLKTGAGATALTIDGNQDVGIGIAPVTGCQLLLPQENDEVTPTHAFGDGDTGLYESVDDYLRFVSAGTARFGLNFNSFSSANTAGGGLLNETTTATNPTVLPRRDDDDTGLGSAGADQLSLIADAKEVTRMSEGNGYVSSITGGTVVETITDASTTAAAATLTKAGENFNATCSVGDAILVYGGTTAADYGTYIVTEVTGATILTVDRSFTGTNADVDFDVLADGTIVENATDVTNHKARLRVSGNSYIGEALFFDEKASQETIVAGEGQIWVKNTAPTTPMFTDDTGDDHIITLGASDYAEMGNEYGADATEVLASAGQWYAMYHANIDASAPHLISGFTFTAGKNGTIASTSIGAGDSVIVTDAAHGLLNGDYITQNGMSDVSYNGVYKVYSKTDDTYTIVETNTTASETGFWQMGSYLKCATAGKYRGVWTSVITQTGTNKKVHIVPYLNLVQSTKAYSYRHYSGATDVGSQAGNGLMNFAVDDRIWFGVQSDLAQTITFKVRNMSIH